jgi:hypothetical protein
MNKPLENNLEKMERKLKRRFPLWLNRFLKTVVFILVAPILIFQIPWVQNKAAQELTKFLSKEWQTEVSIGRVQLGIFNKIKLENFYLEDLDGDTLVYSGNLEVNHSGLFMIPFRQFRIESVKLKNAEVRISRREGQEFQNFQFIVDYFSKGKKDDSPKPSRPFHLNLRHFYLENVHFLKPDEVKGEVFDILVRDAEGHFDRFDLAGKRMDLSVLNLGSPDIKITLLDQKLLPEKRPPAQLTAEKISPESLDTNNLILTIGEFNMGKGAFSLRNIRKEPVRTTPLNILNYNYLDVLDIEIHVNNFVYSDLEFEGEVKQISLRDTTGFVLEKLSAGQAKLSCQGLELYGMELKTPHTRLGDTLVFRYDTYHAWENFENDVEMKGNFNNAHVALQDIMKFAPVLEDNAFFKENKEEVLEIQGVIEGSVNRLDGKNLKLNLAQGVQIEGKFSTFNLAVKDEQFISLKLDRLLTDVKTLRKLIPQFRPPENFDRLGKLDFNGKFDGFFVDFVADGRLKTDIGQAEMFMNLKLREGKEKALYSGDLYLKSFNLGAWSGNDDFGKVTLNTHVTEGKGLTLNSANAKLEGTIDSLVFKGYKYANVTLKGRLEKNLFDGDVNIEDPNINLTFGGEINLTDTLPAFDFKADIRRLALKPLNISPKDLQFFGQVDMHLKGKRLSDIIGEARVFDFQVIKNQKDTLRVDSAVVSSTWLPVGNTKNFSVQSTLGNIDIQGDFDIEKIPARITQFITSNYPAFASRLGIKSKEILPDTARFDFTVELFQLQNLFHFFEEKLDGFDESKITGNYDGYANQLFLEVEVPSWKYQNIEFNDVYFRSKLKGSEGSLQVGVVETKFSETQKLSPVSLIGTIYEDTLEFLVISSNFYKILDNVNINGMLTIEPDSSWRVSFKSSELVILNQTWDINTANYVRIGDGKVETNNFVLSNKDQRIILKSVREEGLELQLKNYPIDSLEFIKNIPNHRISGIADVYAKVKDVFSFQGLSALLRINDLTINGDNYGVLRLDASAPSVKETVTGFLAIENDSMELTVDGYFNPPGLATDNARKWVKDDPLYFDFDVSISNYPTRIVQYFVADVLNVKGSVSAKNIRLYGKPDKPELDGEAFVKDASFKIKPLQATYRVPDGKVRVTSHMFDGTGTYAYDRFGNRAYLEGGITHDHLKDFGLDLRISTEPGKGFLGLETTERDNPVFYGTAIGTGYVRFTGNFKQPSLYVNGKTMPGTHMFMPMTGTTSNRQVRFITFPDYLADKDKEPGPKNPLDLRGLNMEYDLEITPDAKMEVIFDKAWGDVLQGTGNSQLKVIMTREGRFDMYGQFTVVSGNYLFTLMNLGLNKPFIVEPGGTITWNGDPYDAIINVKAVYEGLSTSVYNFIQEYMAAASQGAQDLARSGTNVELKMQLTGQLLQPDIVFDIGFPNLDSELRNYAENKMRTIRQDPNELNRQVFGLLVLGQFLPSGYTIQAGDVGINTLSEMLSTQLSIYLTEFVSEFFTGSNLIQGIDLDISYNRFSAGTTADPSDPTAGYITSELQGRLKVIVNDRISIKGGLDFDLSGSSQIYTTNNSFLTHEVQIEYVISKDRRLKIKVYNSTEPDFAGGRRTKTGAGLSFRKEFDSIQELVSFRKKNKK